MVAPPARSTRMASFCSAESFGHCRRRSVRRFVGAPLGLCCVARCVRQRARRWMRRHGVRGSSLHDPAGQSIASWCGLPRSWYFRLIPYADQQFFEFNGPSPLVAVFSQQPDTTPGHELPCLYKARGLIRLDPGWGQRLSGSMRHRFGRPLARSEEWARSARLEPASA